MDTGVWWRRWAKIVTLGPNRVRSTYLIGTPWGPVRFTIPFSVLPGGGEVVVIGQKAPKEELVIDVTTQLKALVLNACGHQDGAAVKLTAGAAGKQAGAPPGAAIAVTAIGSGGEARGDVDNKVTQMLLSQR